MKTRGAWLFLALALLAFFAPMLLRGHVVFPHDNALQVGLGGDGSGDGEASNLRFSDQSSFYVPELAAHLAAPRSGWIATWTDDVEMGRPLTHLSGLSPAYPPTWCLMAVCSDPFAIYTWLFALTVAATACFAFLFFRALDVDPWVSAVGACCAAFGVPVLYWSSFLMYASGIAWTFALLWLVTRTVEKPSAVRLLGIAAACYALLLSGYPQHIVWHGAFVVAWTIARLARSPSTMQERLVCVGRLAIAVAGSVIAALPVWLDVALAWSRSARTAVDPEFFVSTLPAVGSWSELAAQLALLFDPRLLGDPAAPDFRFLYHGVAFGPLIGFAVLVSWRGGAWREHLPSYVFLALGLGLFFWPAAYRWAVLHAGFGLSRTPPVWGAIVPALVCGTRELDALVRRRERATIGPAIVLLVLGLGTVGGLRWASADFVAAGRESSWVVALALSALALAVLLFVRRGPAIALVAVVIAFVEGCELVLARPRASIQTHSPLVDGLRERLAGGGRYAIVGETPKFVLPANEELLLGLRSVHAYDSLSPTTYQDWVKRFSKEGTRNYGRRFNRITDASLLASGELEKAGVTHVLSAQPLAVPNWKPDGKLGPFFVYATGAGHTRGVLLPKERYRVDGLSATTAGDWPKEPWEEVEFDEDAGDVLYTRLEEDASGRLLVLRQQFHPQWVAGEPVGWCGFGTQPMPRPLTSVLVDGFYQGVLVPPGCDSVVLEVRSLSRLAWVPWLAFALLFGLTVFKRRWRSA